MKKPVRDKKEKSAHEKKAEHAQKMKKTVPESRRSGMSQQATQVPSSEMNDTDSTIIVGLFYIVVICGFVANGMMV